MRFLTTWPPVLLSTFPHNGDSTVRREDYVLVQHACKCCELVQARKFRCKGYVSGTHHSMSAGDDAQATTCRTCSGSQGSGACARAATDAVKQFVSTHAQRTCICIAEMPIDMHEVRRARRCTDLAIVPLHAAVWSEAVFVEVDPDGHWYNPNVRNVTATRSRTVPQGVKRELVMQTDEDKDECYAAMGAHLLRIPETALASEASVNEYCKKFLHERMRKAKICK